MILSNLHPRKLGAVLFFLALMASCNAPAEKDFTYNKEVVQEEEKMLVGYINQEGFTKAPYQEWFDEYYAMYQVGKRNLEDLEPADLEDVDITIFLGTWCSDSQLQVPQFFKILEHLSYDVSKVKMIGLIRGEDENRTLQSPGGEEKGWNITHVPTFILLRDGKEIGRIVEYPEINLETDLKNYIYRR